MRLQVYLSLLCEDRKKKEEYVRFFLLEFFNYIMYLEFMFDWKNY